MRLLDVYDKRLEKKETRFEEGLVASSYRIFIEADDLRIFMTAGWLQCTMVDESAERQIVQCVEKKRKREVAREKLYLVPQAVMPVPTKVNILEAEESIPSFYRASLRTLRKAGYRGIIQTNPHSEINHFLKRVKPFQLYCKVVGAMKWRNCESFRKESFDRFVRDVDVQTKKIHSEHRTTAMVERHGVKNRVSDKKIANTMRSRHL